MIDNYKLLATYKESKKKYIDYFYRQCVDYINHPNKENVYIIYYICCVGRMVNVYDGMINDLEKELHGKEGSN